MRRYCEMPASVTALLKQVNAMLGNDVIDFCSSSLLMNNVTVNASNSYLLFTLFFFLKEKTLPNATV